MQKSHTVTALISNATTPGMPDIRLTITVKRLTGREIGVNHERTCTAKRLLAPENAVRKSEVKNLLLLYETRSIITAHNISAASMRAQLRDKTRPPLLLLY